MSVRTVLSQKSRPYKIEIYGLQDDYLGTLQSYIDSFIGQIIDPIIDISDDGSQSFTCSIPKFYIDPRTNLKTENPRWADIENGVLAANTRVLKAFLQTGEETKVYPFIVDKITDKRDSHFSVYREIQASGLAFSELGKTGYKLELNSHTLETEYEEDETIVATIDYWLDKVFPNEKNSKGKVIKWLSPWCYEIRMDWTHYSEPGRLSNKIYEDSYVGSWTIEEGDENKADVLKAGEVVVGLEKARYIDCANSNKYNITQTLAETFGVFCVYEYKTDERGRFVHTYTDDDGNVWEGRKVIFYNRAIKADKPIVFDYQKNLSSITRVSDSSEIYTKLYVTPIKSEIMSTGLISIANTPVNPILDDFILNFDYMYSVGAISEYQKSFINNYEISLRKLQEKLIQSSAQLIEAQNKVEDLEIKVNAIKNEIEALKTAKTNTETLRNNEVTNGPIVKDKDQPHRVVFVANTQDSISEAVLRLQGIVSNTIVGYTTYDCKTALFGKGTESPLKIVTKKHTPAEDDEQFYLVVDEYNYPVSIYTSIKNVQDEDDTEFSGTLYLTLTYSPTNAYDDICEQLEDMIATKEANKALLESELDKAKSNFEDLEEKNEQDIKDKENLHLKLERVLGPALREGYWTPNSYEDPGEKVSASVSYEQEQNPNGANFIFDDQPFDGEEKGYYYDNVLLETPIYYNYIDLSNAYTNDIWKNNNIEDLVIHLLNPGFKYTLTDDRTFSKGNYQIWYDGVKYYFSTQQDYSNTTLEIRSTGTQLTLYKVNNQGSATKITTLSKTATSGITYNNATSLFEGIGNYLGDRVLYNNAGFVFSFIEKKDNSIIPILLLNNNTIDYTRYTSIAYAFGSAGTILSSPALTLKVVGEQEKLKIRYPRIVIHNTNVNYKSDNLKIISLKSSEINNDVDYQLKKYEDYQILVREGKPYFTFKVVNDNNFYDIFKKQYSIDYQVSRANEALYLDAKNVAFENSQPKYSYEVSTANTPDHVEFLELGQLVYINDHALGVHAATGYITSIRYVLQAPQEDEITIQNYKTKFEDLFSTITASSEAMRNNSASYNIAANGFQSNGLLNGSVLQNSINENNLSFGFSNTNVTIDDSDGITLTNTTAYMNGIFGQVALRGGGIYLSNSVDSSGNRIWNTGITPNGINASLITAGQLDTNLIRVFAGNNLAFQWNSEGIFAYRKDANGIPNLNSYVRYSDKGIQYIDNGFSSVDLGWEGLAINAQNGAVRLTGTNGLEVFNGSNTKLISLGRVDADNEMYGLQLYDANNNVTLAALNGGDLWLKKVIIVGGDKEEKDEKGNINKNVAGISGEVFDQSLEKKAVRFWAGETSTERNNAPFRVLQDGSLFAANANISGTITATDGYIGGWAITENQLSSSGITLTAGHQEQDEQGNTITVPAKIEVGEPGSDQYACLSAEGVSIKGTINATGGQIGNLYIEDISALGGDTDNINVVISTEDSLTYKTGSSIKITFSAQARRGNIPFSITEYKAYDMIWESQTQEGVWTTLRTIECDVEDFNVQSLIQTFEFTVDQQIYIRCRMVQKAVESEGTT